MEPINKARSEADVVLVLGSRLGETDWWGKPPYWGKPDEQKMIQVDIDEEILGLNKATELAVLADAGAFLSALANELRQSPLSDRAPAGQPRTNRRPRGRSGQSSRPTRRSCPAKHGEPDAQRPGAGSVPALLRLTTRSTCSMAATRQCGRASSPRSTDRTRYCRPSNWECWAQVSHRHLAGKSPSPMRKGRVHHRRWRDGLSHPRARNRPAQRASRHLPRALRQAVGHGEAHAIDRARDATSRHRNRAAGHDQRRLRRDRSSTRSPRRWGVMASEFPTLPSSRRRSSDVWTPASRRSYTSTSTRTCTCSRRGFKSSRRCTRSPEPDGLGPRGLGDRGGRLRRPPLRRGPLRTP